MDAGSYSEKIIKVVSKYSQLFYIRANDHKSTEKEVIGYYNQRGATEKTFDIQNNDFGWNHLPTSCQQVGLNDLFSDLLLYPDDMFTGYDNIPVSSL